MVLCVNNDGIVFLGMLHIVGPVLVDCIVVLVLTCHHLARRVCVTCVHVHMYFEC